MAWAGTSRTELAPYSVWEWRGAGPVRGNTVRLCRAWRTGHRGVNHRPLAAGLLLGGKAGSIMWEEPKGAENCLEDDLDGLNRTGTKRAAPLCLDMRETLSDQGALPQLKKKKTDNFQTISQ